MSAHKQLYQVRIAKNDSISNVTYEDVIHVWHQKDMLVLEKGERGVNRSYIYWPIANIDHVHITEQQEVSHTQ